VNGTGHQTRWHDAWRARWRDAWHDESAATAVEFSIIASLLFVLLFGAIDWSRLMYNRGRIRSAVRNGALYAARVPTASFDSATIAARTRAALIGTATEQALGVVDVELTGTNGSDQRVQVAWLSYPFTRATALVNIAAGRQDTVKAEFRREQP